MRPVLKRYLDWIIQTRAFLLWERFRRHTVWHPANVSPYDDDRSGPRFWYPIYDVLAFCLGITALSMGSPLLNQLFPPWFTNGMGIFLMVSSVSCMVGVIIPRLSFLELLGKLGIVFLLGAYAGTVAFLSENFGANWFVVIVLIMSVWLLGPRVTKLSITTYRLWTYHRSRKGVR